MRRLLWACVFACALIGNVPGPAGARPEKFGLISRQGERFVEREMIVTAYTAGPESTGKKPGDPGYGITASGAKVRRGAVSADPSIPFGTRVFIPGYGPGVVLDRGGKIKGDRLDVYFENLEDALEWGVRKVTVRFYERGQ